MKPRIGGVLPHRLQCLVLSLLAFTLTLHWAPGAGDHGGRLRADIAFLSSPALEGRVSLGRGAEVAAAFIEAEFRKAGLRPANGSSFLQNFPVSPVRLDRGSTAGLVKRGVVEQRIAITSVSFADPLHPVNVSGEVVFAGFGITAPELGYDDYTGIDARGKIALVFDHEPRETDPASPFNGTGFTKYAGQWYKTWNAQRHGAIAVLVATEPVNAHRAPAPEPDRASAPSQALVESELRIPCFRTDSDGLSEILSRPGRTPTDWQREIERNLKPASRHLPNVSVRLEAANLDAQACRSSNIAGLIEGSDPARIGETIIICAHYDHLGVHNGKPYVGANDNATGVAALIEVARRFGEQGLRPPRSVLFIAFGSEEQAMLGSYYYVARPLRDLRTTRAVVNMDMIGRNEEHTDETRGSYEISPDTSNELNLVACLYARGLADLIARENRAVGLQLTDKFDRESSTRALFRCDHLPFLYHEIPAIWLFGGFHPGYHTPADTTDKLNYAKVEKVTELAFLTVRAAAAQETVELH
jgi:hypothetical protein